MYKAFKLRTYAWSIILNFVFIKNNEKNLIKYSVYLKKTNIKSYLGNW